MSLTFAHTTLGQRVLFGAGKIGDHLSDELMRLGARRPMIIAGGSARESADELAARIDPALSWNEVTMHVPVELAQRARAAAAEAEVDVIVSIGGGSATGLAKAVALTQKVPVIAVPTTYSGSEATNVWGLTEDGTKRTGNDDIVLPATVIYDAELTASLPRDLAISSGLNALAHSVDSLWGPRADPINQALALESAQALTSSLIGLSEEADLASREQALYGCYLAAVAFASAGSGLHHKICHVLGGTFDLPHAQTHSVVLPYVLAFNASAVPELSNRLSASLSAGRRGGAVRTQAQNLVEPTEAARDVSSELRGLYQSVGAPSSLDSLGFTADGIDEAVKRIVDAAPASNPAEVTPQAIRRLLSAALTGAPADTLISS